MSMRLTQIEWPVVDLSARLADSDAVVCIASLLSCGEDLRGCLALLSPTERQRYFDYTNDVVGRRFACGRGLVRSMLGSVLGLAAVDVPLREGLHGKPYLAAQTARAVWFSVSHADELLVVAMSRSADVGIDVERARGFEHWQRVADRVLDEQERRQLDAAIAAGDDSSEAFLRHWCRVEAELKAIGCGIAGLEAHRAGMRPRGLRLADLAPLKLPPDVAATGYRFQAAVALCTPGADSLRQASPASAQASSPTTRPASASTP